MYCPNCGSQNKKKQNFCRFCGLHLQDIEKTFASQLVFGDDTKRLKHLRTVRQTTDTAQMFAGVMLAVGIVGLIFFDPRSGKAWITAGLLSFFIAQLVRAVSGYLQRRSPRQNVAYPDAEAAAPAGEVAGARETNRLIEDRPFTPAQSIVENTTRQLRHEARERD